VPLVKTGHWMPDDGRGNWHIQRMRSGLLSMGIPLLILSIILFSRCRQSVLSTKDSTFIVYSNIIVI
jgi:hypothetical protein